MLIKGASLFDVTGIQINQSARQTASDDSFNWKNERILGTLMNNKYTLLNYINMYHEIYVGEIPKLPKCFYGQKKMKTASEDIFYFL